MRRFLLSVAAVMLGLGGAARADTAPQRIVAVGGAITEIVYALGQQDRLVARDTTSIHPEAALALPDVGYVRALPAEGLLSVNPGLVIAAGDIGPPETLEVLRAAQIALVSVPDTPTGEGILTKIRVIGDTLGVPGAAADLAQRVKADLDRATDRAEAIPEAQRKRVLFVLSMQGGRMMAAGRGTSAAAVIEMAGGRNALTGFEGYKPISDEAILAAAPDAILLMTRGGSDALSDAALLALPAIAATPAGQSRTILRMDGLYLLGFGPRTAQAVNDLTDSLYGG